MDFGDALGNGLRLTSVFFGCAHDFIPVVNVVAFVIDGGPIVDVLRLTRAANNPTGNGSGSCILPPVVIVVMPTPAIIGVTSPIP